MNQGMISSTPTSNYTMNWPAKTGSTFNILNRLAAIVLPAIFLYSCQGRGDNISSSTLDRNDDYTVVFTDSFEISSSTFLRDSVNSSFPVNCLVGDFQNNAYGRVSCNSFFQVVLNNLFAPGADANYDSMVLVLDAFYHYGAEDGIISMGVHRLKQTLSVDSTYYSFDNADYYKEPLATVTYTANDLRKKRLRIHLNELGLEFTDKVQNDQDFSSTFFTADEQFVEYFKGLALITNFAENSVAGFSPVIGSNSSQTGLYYYYHFIDSSDSGQDPDTILDSYRFGINQDGAGFNEIISERPMELSFLKEGDVLVPNETTMEQGYVQAGSGLLTYLEIPNIDDFQDQYENIIVNRAEIIITSIDNDIPYYDPPETLFMFRADSNQNILDWGAGAFNEIGIAIKNENDYLIDITGYFQSLIEGRVEKSGYIFVPPVNASSVNQLIFNGPNASTTPMRLLVYYIPVN